MKSIVKCIRPSTPSDAPRLYEIWRGAVEATHHFLSAEHLELIAFQVKHQYLPEAGFQVVVDASDRPLAFMGMTGFTIDSLFVDPAFHGKGIGRLLIELARRSHHTLYLDVNEQNPGARTFYERMGFRIVGRSEFDGEGRPYPLLHLRLN
ncbi:acetyltransferase [Pseudomonas subflava]|uniref:acetyltransferase n=1 Tax=Pseudomonas subflava TaxID=2952933 RepID=UPI00207A9D8E|nr:acetyltransferase [Pseudomonas subflava]